MKKWFCVVALLTVAALALPAYANNYGCTGTVTMVFLNSSGVVVVQGPGGVPPVGICTVNGGSGAFSADACRAVYSMLLAAKLSGQNVQLNFSDNLTCSTQPAWGGPTSTTFWAVSTQ